MKGLVLSLLTLLLYGLSTMVAGHVLRPKRHLYLFVCAIPICAIFYVLFHLFTPVDLGFLSGAWTASNQLLDLLYGLAIFLFGCHSFVCVVFVACSSFSISLLVVIRQAGTEPTTTESLVAEFQVDEERDRIYGWRVPHLEKRGYIKCDPTTGRYSLTSKGWLIAQAAWLAKRTMNLGEGG